MRVLLPIVGFMLTLGGNLTHAEQYERGPYIGLSAGYLWLNDVGDGDVNINYDDGFDVGVHLGYKYWIWRLEAEFEYGQSGFDSIEVLGSSVDVDGDFDILRWSGSVYYDLDNFSKFAPYFGGGLGVAYIDFDDVTIGTITVEGDSDTYFTAHGEVGVSVALNDQFAVVPAYRYLWFDSGEAGFDDDTAHLFKIGVRFGF